MELPRLSILPLAIVVICLIGLTNNAYATLPVVTSFTLQNLDNSDPAYSDGDTLTITFDIDTDRGGFPLNVPVGNVNVTNLYDFADFLGNDFDGQWTSDRSFVITVIDSTAHSVQIGLSSFDPGPIPIRDAVMPADIWSTISPVLTLFLTDSGGGDGCDTECQPPTLGLDQNGNRLVEDGFSYNGNPVDVELFYTPYPLIKTSTGVFNTAKLKIYDNSGPDAIRHVELAFGLAKGQTINERKASILWDKHFDGTEVVNVISPSNAIDSVKVESYTNSCTSKGNYQCLVLLIHHRFRQPLDFDIVGTNVWDDNRNAWQNYYNHGIDVQGKSLNPPSQHYAIYNGHLVQITEVAKNTAIDNDGNTWRFDKTWRIDTTPKGKIDDGVTSHWFDRNNARFDTYKKGQELLAQHTMNLLTGGSIQNDDLEEPKTHYSEFIKRGDDPDLQRRIALAKHNAGQMFNQLFDVEQNH